MRISKISAYGLFKLRIKVQWVLADFFLWDFLVKVIHIFGESAEGSILSFSLRDFSHQSDM